MKLSQAQELLLTVQFIIVINYKTIQKTDNHSYVHKTEYYIAYSTQYKIKTASHINMNLKKKMHERSHKRIV